jgi:hypothetical protein
MPGHPVRPQDDVAAYRAGLRKQRTVNPLMIPARYNLSLPFLTAVPARLAFGTTLRGYERVDCPERERRERMAAEQGKDTPTGPVPALNI